MIYRLVTHKGAEADLDGAYNWYEDKKEGLGEEFLHEFQECCKRIADFPLGYPAKHRHFRQAHLRRFPFIVIYEIVENDIIINSVFHTSRNPAQKFRKT